LPHVHSFPTRRSSELRRWIEERAASSAGQHNVSLSTLLTMPVPLPPLEEQTEILTTLDTQLSAAKEQEIAITHSLHQTAAQRRKDRKSTRLNSSHVKI